MLSYENSVEKSNNWIISYAETFNSGYQGLDLANFTASHLLRTPEGGSALR